MATARDMLDDDCQMELAIDTLNDTDVLSRLNSIEPLSVINFLSDDVVPQTQKQRIRRASDDATAVAIFIEALKKSQVSDKMETFLTALHKTQRLTAKKIREKYNSLVEIHKVNCELCKQSGQVALAKANSVLDDGQVRDALLKADYKSLVLQLPDAIVTQNNKDTIYNTTNPAQALNDMIRSLKQSLMPDKIDIIISKLRDMGQGPNAQIIEGVQRKICG